MADSARKRSRHRRASGTGPGASPHARRTAALLRRYQRFEALRPFTCALDPDHYLLEPYTVAGDVLLVCPTCGHAELFIAEEQPDLESRVERAAAFWRGIPQY